MQHQDHELLKDLLLQLADEPPARRDALLARIRAQHPDMSSSLDEYVHLLDSAEESLLGRRDDAIPAFVGPYRVERLLGEGGMGRVFLATEPPPLERRVALKLIRPGFGTADMVTRFEFERDTLKSLEHPNIARVIDAGRSDEGLPYVTMEFVDGLAIRDYCRLHALRLDQRLRLLLQVCEGVGEAHLKGIVHRDIKPANVLVAGAADRPCVKLIDFGIATLIHAGAAAAHQTAPGFPLGTIEYMSPEQACGDRTRVDRRSDIYSIGVLMYELCTGAVPHDRSTLLDHAGPGLLDYMEQQRVVPPSARLAGVATADHEDAGPLRRRLRELDWVVLKAIAPDPRGRYRSADQLAEDVQAVLDDRPVSAAPPSRLYRLRKQIRRKPALASTIGVGVVSLVIVTGVLLASSSRVRQSLRETRAALEAEAAASADSEAAIEFLVGMLAAAGPGQSASDRSVSDMLIDASDRLVKGLDEQPRVRWRVATLLANTLGTTRDLQRASTLIDAAIADATGVFGPRSPQVGSSMHVKARILALRGDNAGAQAALSQSTTLLDAGGEPWLRERLSAMSTQAALLASVGRESEAIELHRRALDLWSSHYPDDLGAIRARLALALRYSTGRRFDEAEALLSEAISATQRLGATDFQTRSQLLEFERTLSFHRGDYARGRAAASHLADLYVEWYGPADERTFMSRLASYTFDTDEKVDWNSVIDELRELLGLADASLKYPSRVSTTIRHELGQALREAGRAAEAASTLEEALAQAIALWNAQHPNVAAARAALATAHMDAGRLDEAREHAEAARKILTSRGTAHVNLPAIERLLQQIEQRSEGIAPADDAANESGSGAPPSP